MENDYNNFAELRQVEIKKGIMKSHAFVEKPMMRSMLPDLSNKKVLLLGCGTGDETKILEEFNARNMIGIDLSEKSVEIAKRDYSNYTFIVGDMHNLPFADEEFDFVYSSLVLHYTKDIDVVMKEVNRVLKTDGEFLFSVGHPLRWSSEKIDIDGTIYHAMGFDNDTKNDRIIGNYMSLIKKKHYFRNNEVLEFYSVAPSYYFKEMVKAGFDVKDFSESQCIDECKDVDILYYKRFHEFPQFMAFLGKKRS